MTAARSGIPEIGPGSRLRLHRLVVRREDDEYVIGRVETNHFVAMPSIGVNALRLLDSGMTVADAAAELGRDLGADVDVADFAANLIALGFVRAVDDAPLPDTETFTSSLPWLRPAHVGWLFGPCARLVLGAIACAAAVSVVAVPEVLPTPTDFLWTQHTSVALAVNSLAVWINIAVHELAHLVAARSLGVASRVGLGTRLHDLVAQTDVTGLWALERRRRYRVYLAGMCWDLLHASVLVLLVAHGALPPTVHEAAEAMILLLGLSLVSQFEFYMRTDVYYVIAAAARTRNLAEDAAAYALALLADLRTAVRERRKRGQAALRRQVLVDVPPGEQRVVRLYAPFMVLGSAVAVLLFVVTALPIMAALYAGAITSVGEGLDEGHPWTIADGTVTLVLMAGTQALFVFLLWRNRGSRVAPVRTRVAATRRADVLPGRFGGSGRWG